MACAVEKLEVNFSESADNTKRLKIRRKKTHAINTERDMCPRVLSGGNNLSEEIRAPGFDPDTMSNSTYRVRKVSAEVIENSYEAATSTLKLRNSSICRPT